MEQWDKLKEILECSQYIVFFGGAGVSTESDIPDFRSEDGIYQEQKYEYPPEVMLSRSFFNQHMEQFYQFYVDQMIYQDAKPNPAHIALAHLEKQGKLKAVITQNIDGLHQQGGSNKVLELHGSVQRNYCMSCKAPYDVEFVIGESREKGIPKCSKCGGVVKPDVVLYEESLNDEVMEEAIQQISKADTLIVGGTSLAVYPAAGFLQFFQGKHLVLINRDETSYDQKADLVIREPIGQVLSGVVEYSR